MTPRDIFKIIVASVGLYLVYHGVMDLITGFTYTLHLTDYPPGAYEGTNKFFAVQGVMEIVVGIGWMAGFFPFVNLAFPEKPQDESENGTEEQQEDQGTPSA